jgi:hypothetical protein
MAGPRWTIPATRLFRPRWPLWLAAGGGAERRRPSSRRGLIDFTSPCSASPVERDIVDRIEQRTAIAWDLAETVAHERDPLKNHADVHVDRLLRGTFARAPAALAKRHHARLKACPSCVEPLPCHLRNRRIGIEEERLLEPKVPVTGRAATVDAGVSLELRDRVCWSHGYSIISNLQGVGSTATSRGRARLVNETTAWPGASSGNVFQRASSIPPIGRRSRLTT